MRRQRRRRTNFYNQNIKKMNIKQFTITLTDFETSQNLELRNNGFEPFELIGILIHVLEKRKQKLDQDNHETESLDKEMD